MPEDFSHGGFMVSDHENDAHVLPEFWFCVVSDHDRSAGEGLENHVGPDSQGKVRT